MKTFTNLYPISKTLKFELIPIGKTIENINNKGLISEDEERKEKYNKAKKILDEFHRYFISDVLNHFSFEESQLLDFHTRYYHKKNDESSKKGFEEVRKKMRITLAKAFKKHPNYKILDKKELFKDSNNQESLLKNFLSNISEDFFKENNIGSIEEANNVIDSFSDFTTYFTGFNTIRQNLYSEEEISSSIAYRLVHQNLPFFLDNLLTFDKIKSNISDCQLKQLQKELELIIQVESIDEMFKLSYFNNTLSQKGIDVYNHLIGGYSTKNGEKIKGLNELINLYNQQQSDKKNKIPKLKILYKQILSDKETASFIPDEFTSDKEVIESIIDGYTIIRKLLFNSTESETEKSNQTLQKILESFAEYDLSKIFIKNDSGLTAISQKCSGQWSSIEEGWILKYDLKNGSNIKNEKYIEKRTQIFNKIKSFSISEINEYLSILGRDNTIKLEEYFSKTKIFELIIDNYKSFEILCKDFESDNISLNNINAKEKIKCLLDSIKDIQHFVKPLVVDDESEKDEMFYSDFLNIWKELDSCITPLYNKVRNYATKKPYSIEKFKLNFKNSTLLDGWDLNKEKENTATILLKDKTYYLCIIDKKHNYVFEKIPSCSSDATNFRKMNYKYFPDASKMIPKCSTQLKDVLNHFISGKTSPISVKKNFESELEINREIFELNNMIYDSDNMKFILKSEEDSKGPKKFQKEYLKITQDNIGYRDALKKWIDFCKVFLSKYSSTSNYKFNFKKSEDYASLDEFYKEIICYNISYSSIPESYINDLINDGKIYLFKIHNKDFSSFSKGTPNLHTLYWNEIFNEANTDKVLYKLNGQAEIFYRKSSISDKNYVVHRAGVPVKNKNQLNQTLESTFNYDIIKNKRFTVDKFQFHVPITLNFDSSNINNINYKVHDFIREKGIKHIIGIDRGERHLLYLTVIDLNGIIVEQYSLNEIINEFNGKPYITDYHQLLDNKEKERNLAKKDWQTIENIKELKEGYLSQVINRISNLMIKYNAIIVLEDLNSGFKRGRQKVEKQVYQKFEKMLIDKLNFLVNKKAKNGEICSLRNALQLTNKFEGFQNIGKQNGFIFYVPAWNTSKMDPTTGFVNLIDTRYKSIEESKKLFNNFQSITYNKKELYFEFHIHDYKLFNTISDGTKTDWIICSYGDRIITERNKNQNNEWCSTKVCLTNEWTKFLEKNDIDVNSNIKESILCKNDKEFFREGLSLLGLTLQMRNSIPNTFEDFMISPIKNANGTFFDSRKSEKTLPLNADANGAYNIARKGLWIVNQINNSSKNEKLNLSISNKDWLKLSQE